MKVAPRTRYLHRRLRRRPEQRALADQRLMMRHAETELIACEVGGAPAQHLGSYVAGRSDQRAGARQVSWAIRRVRFEDTEGLANLSRLLGRRTVGARGIRAGKRARQAE